MSDAEHKEAQQALLLRHASRAMAACVGRGALSLGAERTPLGAAAPPPLVPPLCVSGVLLPSGGALQLDAAALGRDWGSWAQFHNGLAHALRCAAAPAAGALPRQWAGPGAPSGARAGVLLGLGLRGYLRGVPRHDLYDFLTCGHELTVGAALLGVAASERGSGDARVSKMLLLHVPSLLPQQLAALEVPPVAQQSAVAGLGLLYMGTAHRLMAEFLVAEIARRPLSDAPGAPEAYAASAGLALGMVVLGRGRRGPGGDGLADLELERRLVALVRGGKLGAAAQTRRREKEGGPWYEHAHQADRADGRAGAGDRAEGAGGRTSRFLDGDCVNTAVTAPAAALALALLHLRSGSAFVGDALRPPGSWHEIRGCRPELLGLLVAARALVRWDLVRPTEDWIYGNVPKLISDEWDQLPERARAAARGDWPEEGAWPPEGPARRARDASAVKAARVAIVGGACLALGLRFAGTQHAGARRAALRALLDVSGLQQRRRHALRPSRSVLEAAIASCALGAAMVCAGSGDLEVMRQLRRIRGGAERWGFGLNQALHTALGLLFLGAGDYALSNDDGSVAFLLCAAFPALPAAPDDGSRFLPSLRWLWVLAARRRSLAAVDVRTGDPAFLPVEVVLRAGSEAAAAAVSAMASRELAARDLWRAGAAIARLDGVPPWALEADLRAALAPLDFVLIDRGAKTDSNLRTAYCRFASDRAAADALRRRRAPLGAGGEAVEAQPLSPEAYAAFLNRAMAGTGGPAAPRVVLRCVAPCLLPPAPDVEELRSASPRYYPLRCRGAGALAGGVLRVKRRAGHLPYLQDPEAHAALDARPVPSRCLGLLRPEDASPGRRRPLAAALEAEPMLKGFAKAFGAAEGAAAPEAALSDALLADCLKGDKPELAAPARRLAVDAAAFRRGEAPSPLAAANLRLVRAYHGRPRDALVALALSSHAPQGAAGADDTALTALTALDEDGGPLGDTVVHDDVLGAIAAPGKAPALSALSDAAPMLWDAPVRAAGTLGAGVQAWACADVAPLVPEPLARRLRADMDDAFEGLCGAGGAVRRYIEGGEAEDAARMSAFLVYYGVPPRQSLRGAMERGGGAEEAMAAVEDLPGAAVEGLMMAFA